MPPELFSWDRRGFRKYDRPGSDPSLGGGFGGGGAIRWRDQHHPQPPPPSSHPYHHHQQRWYSGFRSRPLPHGLGKQGGRDIYQESSHGFPSFGSRYNDRILDDVNFRPLGSCNDGIYFRNSREIRGSFSHKVVKSHYRDPGESPCGPRRPISGVNEQSYTENVKLHNNGSNKCDNNSSHPQPDALKLPEQSLSPMKGKNEGSNEVSACKGQPLEKENSLGSIDWKSFKWTRSGSLSSNGSGFGDFSTSTSVGADSNYKVAEVKPKNSTPFQSLSGEAAGRQSADSASSKDASSRKKPRLRFGEGLKNYEKKKIESPEDDATKDRLDTSVSDTEAVQSHATNLADNSPKAAASSDHASPAAPNAVASSSTAGVREKRSSKAIVDHDLPKLSCSPSILSQVSCEGPSFCLENSELTSSANWSSLIGDLIKSDDSNFVRSTAMSKLLLWKVDVLKALEMTESEIDAYETELKALTCEARSSFPCPSVSSSLTGDINLENTPEALDDEDTEVKAEYTSSRERLIPKFVEMPSAKDVCPGDTANHVKDFVNSDVDTSRNLEVNCLNVLNDETKGDMDDSELVLSRNCPTPSCTDSYSDGEGFYNLILVSNKDSAERASKVLKKLLPINHCHLDISNAARVSCLLSDPMVTKKKFLKRKQFLRFKEKVISLKFKVLHHLWKEDQLHSIRRVRSKSHKKLDICRTDYVGHLKHHSSFPFRFSPSVSAGRSFSLVPTEEVIHRVSRFISNAKVKPYRNTLEMPVLILDKKEKLMSRFISSNSLVEDPEAVEKERSMINIWTSEEREIFIDKLAAFGKDFSKIASFLDHKTTADCIEFYYKNHKSEYFEKAKKKPGFLKQRKARSSSTYLVASAKKWNREANAASLDILGAATALAASFDADLEIQQKCSSRVLGVSAHRESRNDVGSLQRSNSLDIRDNRETTAVDVLASICGSLSTEAMSSCITSSMDPAEVHEEVYDSCLDESPGEMDTTYWTDEETSIFIQAVSSYGKDFAMISRRIGTRSMHECKVFFSKARKRLGLDAILPGSSNGVSADGHGGGSDDTEDACVVESGSVIYSERSGCEMGDHLMSPDLKTSSDSDRVEISTLKSKFNRCEENNGIGLNDFMAAEDSGPSYCKVKKVHLDSDADASNEGVTRGTVAVSRDTESLRVIEEIDDHVQSKRLEDNENEASIEVPDQYRKAGVASHQCAYEHSSTQLDITLGCQKRTSNESAASAALANAAGNARCHEIAPTGNRQHHLSISSFSDCVESSQILGNFEVSRSTVKEINVDINCRKAVSLGSDSKVDGKLQAVRSSGFHLQKCGSSRDRNFFEAPIPLQEQRKDHVREGGVKLFGQILISQEKQNSSVLANDNKIRHHKRCNRSFQGGRTMNLNSAQAKFHNNDNPSSENIPVKNIHSWDGNTFQTAFSPFPNSTLLFGQEPAVVTNNTMPSDKLKQPLSHRVVESGECRLDSGSHFPTQERNSSNGVADDKVPRNREGQPFTLEMQRAKGFDVMSGTRQPEKGVVGINVGSHYSSVSDPVEVLKMHYARAGKLCPPPKNIMGDHDVQP